MRAPRPWHFFVLVIPFGVSFGWVTVALPYVARQKGLGVETISGIVAAAFVPHFFKVLWAPVVDATLTRKTWYVIALALLAAGTLAMMAMPISASSVPALEAVVVGSQVGLTLLYMACEGILGRALPPERKSTAASWLQAGSFFGLGVGGSISLEIVSFLPGALAGAIVAAALCLCALPLLAFDEPADHEVRGVGAALRSLARELGGLMTTRTGVIALFAAISTIGCGAASALFTALAGDWHASRGMVGTTNGWLAGIIQASGAGLAGLAMKRLDRRIVFALAGGLTALMATGMALGPRTAAAYGAFTLLYNAALGAGYASFSAFAYASIGKRAVATKYNILASLMNLSINRKLKIEGTASRRWGDSGVLLTDAAITLGGIVLLALVIVLAGRPAPTEQESPS